MGRGVSTQACSPPSAASTKGSAPLASPETSREAGAATVGRGAAESSGSLPGSIVVGPDRPVSVAAPRLDMVSEIGYRSFREVLAPGEKWPIGEISIRRN